MYFDKFFICFIMIIYFLVIYLRNLPGSSENNGKSCQTRMTFKRINGYNHQITLTINGITFIFKIFSDNSLFIFVCLRSINIEFYLRNRH